MKIVTNFSLKSGGLLKVELEMQNCPLTDGQLVPDLDLDTGTGSYIYSDLFICTVSTGK